MKAQELMTRGVISIDAEASILEAAKLMLQRNISGLPVVDDKNVLVGIVTEGDFLRRGELGTQRHRPRWLEFLIGPGRLASEYVRTRGGKVKEIMTPNPYTVTADADLEDVVQLMERHHIKRLPVLQSNKLVGIVSRANLMAAVASLARQVPGPTPSDEAIRAQILAEIDKVPWAPGVNVIVQKGRAELHGIIPDERERQALIVAAENVPGVKEVHDHLVWVEPMSAMVFLSEEDEAKAQTAAGGA